MPFQKRKYSRIKSPIVCPCFVEWSSPIFFCLVCNSQVIEFATEFAIGVYMVVILIIASPVQRKSAHGFQISSRFIQRFLQVEASLGLYCFFSIYSWFTIFQVHKEVAVEGRF